MQIFLSQIARVLSFFHQYDNFFRKSHFLSPRNALNSHTNPVQIIGAVAANVPAGPQHLAG